MLQVPQPQPPHPTDHNTDSVNSLCPSDDMAPKILVNISSDKGLYGTKP